MLTKRQIRLAVNFGVIFFLCSAAMAIDKQKAAIAVWDLDYYDTGNSTFADMGELLSAKVIESVEKSENYSVVEREKLLLVLEEQNRAQDSLVSFDTRLEIGRIVGARLMIFGSYFVINNTMRLDLHFVEVETGSILNSASKETAVMDPMVWLNMIEKASEELLMLKSPYK